jgi:uncharacterized membrane protein YkgB
MIPSTPNHPALDRLDQTIAGWMRRHGVRLTRLSLGVVFVWFGALKPFRISPADELVERTVYWFDPAWFIPLLGVWEVAIGVCLLIRPLNRVAILLLLLQMPGTMLPLVLLPEVCFTHIPWAPTLEGQYIIKNLVLISAAIVVGGMVRHKSDESMDQPPSGSRAARI